MKLKIVKDERGTSSSAVEYSLYTARDKLKITLSCYILYLSKLIFLCKVKVTNYFNKTNIILPLNDDLNCF